MGYRLSNSSQMYITDPYKDKIEQYKENQKVCTANMEALGQDTTIRREMLSARASDESKWLKDNHESLQGEEQQNQENKNVEEAIQERQQTISAPVYEHLVRGALLRCTCGSHCRRLNLPVSHNCYYLRRDLMNREDSIPGNKEACESDAREYINIPYFGVCKSEKADGPTVLLRKDVDRDPWGNEIPQEKKNAWFDDNDKNVKGPVCKAAIMSTWLCPDENCLVDGKPAIREDSFLVCAYGGIIEVVNSGQKYNDNVI